MGEGLGYDTASATRGPHRVTVPERRGSPTGPAVSRYSPHAVTENAPAADRDERDEGNVSTRETQHP